MSYLSWQKQTINDFSAENINDRYDRGFVFTRPENGAMQQTRSIRIDLSDWETTSENRRILRKTADLKLEIKHLPLDEYDWAIGKMGKDFYETKFGDGTFSANKIKELMTSPERTDFNRILTYSVDGEKAEGWGLEAGSNTRLGYCIAVETNTLLHYSYPFYNLQQPTSNLGMAMMIRAVQYAKESGKQYIYLGSFQRPGDVYKLQFKNMQWFDGEMWRSDLDKLKSTVTMEH